METTQVAPIILEVNDSGENPRSIASIDSRFRELIRSFGFEIEDGKHISDTNDIEIDGIRMVVDYKSASYYGTNAYTKKRGARKYRFIIIKTSWGSSDNIARISLNKEIDGNKLIKKLKDFIDERKKLEKSAKDREKAENDQMESLRVFYSQCNLPQHIRRINVHQGMISLMLRRLNAELFISTANGKIFKFLPPQIESVPMSDVDIFSTSSESLSKHIKEVDAILNTLGAPPFKCDSLNSPHKWKHIDIECQK